MSFLERFGIHLPRKRRKKRGSKARGGAARRIPTMESKPSSKKSGSELRPYPRYRSSRQRPSRLKRILKRTALYSAIAGTLLFSWVLVTLPNIEELNKFTKTPSILIKSQDGQIIGSFGDIYGAYIPFEQLPQSLVDAVIATEDRNFYHHFGIDPYGIARAMYANFQAGRIVQGASTITQQVAKNVFLTPERSWSRKIREIILALKLERRFTKQEIMSIYVNRVYLGAGSYGVDAASRRYFGIPAQQMSLSESAIMAGLLKAPSKFAPTSNPTLSRKRAEQVLLNMQDAGYLTAQQTARAREELTKSMNGRTRSAQSTFYFADWIMDQIPNYIGNIQEDLVVISTLRPDLQLIAEKAINDVMDKEGESHRAEQAALVAMTPDGAVRAMIGGRSYARSQYNRATQALRQPGSSFKLFVYLAGLESGLTPDSYVDDQPVRIKVSGGYWQPKNYSGRYEGAMSLRQAVARSINTIAVQTAQQAGFDRVVNMARRLGVTSELSSLPSLALGATEVSLLEMTGAYAHLAANGALVNAYGILAIDNAQGKPVYRRQGSNGMVLRRSVVGMMNDMLMGVVNNGTGRAARIGRPAAGKTGTTSDYRDAWFMGYTPDLVTGVWVGNDDNSSMKKVTGGTLPAAIWNRFMVAALSGTPISSLPTSGGEAALPWQEGATVNTDAPPQRRERSGGRDVELGDSFWNKLLGPSRKGEVEYQYPGQ